MLRSGLLLVSVTFAAVALVLLGQAANATVLEIRGLHYLLAACDPPAVIGGWLSAFGAFRSRSAGPVPALLTVAAVALTLVAGVVLGDLALGRVSPSSTLAAALGSKPAWLAADVGTVVALGSAALASARLCNGAARPLGAIWAAVIVATLSLRAIGGVWGALAPAPWPFRVLEAALYAAVARGLFAASSCVDRATVRP